MNLKIYYMPIDCSSFTSVDCDMLPFISKERQERINQFRCIHDKKLALYSGLLIRMQLSNLFNISNNRFKFYLEPFHKPKCLNLPQVDFSISHTKGLILCGISNNGKIGVDVEKISNINEKIMDCAFTPLEKDYILKSKSFQRERFFKIWTQKEAYSKYLESGLCKNIFKTNTLEPKFAYNSHSWSYNDFLCSVFTQNPKEYEIQSILDTDIQKFFLK